MGSWWVRCELTPASKACRLLRLVTRDRDHSGGLRTDLPSHVHPGSVAPSAGKRRARDQRATASCSGSRDIAWTRRPACSWAEQQPDRGDESYDWADDLTIPLQSGRRRSLVGSWTAIGGGAGRSWWRCGRRLGGRGRGGCHICRRCSSGRCRHLSRGRRSVSGGGSRRGFRVDDEFGSCSGLAAEDDMLHHPAAAAQTRRVCRSPGRSLQPNKTNATSPTFRGRPCRPFSAGYANDVSYMPLDLELGTCRNRRPHHGLTTGISPEITGRRHA